MELAKIAVGVAVALILAWVALLVTCSPPVQTKMS
jgi:hypothetical protein